MITFIDSLTICEQDGHKYQLDTPWTTCAFGLFVKYDKCENCDKLKRYSRYKWMGVNTKEI